MLEGDNAVRSLIEIESSTGRTDRLAVASLEPHAVPVETLRPAGDAADPESNANAKDSASIPDHAGDISLNDLCNALFTSAQDNNLPIAFFANLIWQESRLRDDAVSSKGALGIAQFMPETAAESGLDDPFDPLQAIPASARLLSALRLQFGNLGFVAAAYNAGPRRVAEWLEHRGSLPRETRGYVVRVTGLSVDAWRSIAVADDALTFVRQLALPQPADLRKFRAGAIGAGPVGAGKTCARTSAARCNRASTQYRPQAWRCARPARRTPCHARSPRRQARGRARIRAPTRAKRTSV